MRELRFRAWDKEEKEMYNLKDMFGESKFSHLLYVNENTVTGKGDVVFMQYTGKKDKDKTPIVEGDILEAPNTKNPCQWVVVWVEDEARFGLDRYVKGKKDDETYGINTPFELKVIGDIYQNPELLEAKEK